ncbi:hypothetical protein CLU96_1343 [Chryseobacterium sp. 52]|uniref:DUF6493 family protein n=1 Tax=Chryseobacterium sp. 52 TaxID=2035213 RepID=UPI000C189310|nr:DUF6493 family protein [Chryseobacterium sp. 52]PIF44377.1 hypothetical protein CLU96_1343 [Chryseobacterium sp. 52]
MLIGDELKTIYLNYRIKEIVPFLIKLTQKEKKETAVIVKKFLNKDWGHNHISMLTVLACSNTKDQYENLASGYYAIPAHLVDELFQSCVPEWIGSSYVFLRNIDYLKVLEWQQKGYFTLSDEVTAKLLSESLASNPTAEEILFSYPVTINSHIWLLFQYDSNLTDNYNNGKNWKILLKDLLKENKIERSRLLKSCLHAIALNFSKDHNTWFLELFSYLEPSNSEIIELQDNLFSVFHSPQHSLFVPVLKIINPVITESGFKTDDFLHAAVSLPGLQVKNILNALLQTLDKIVKNDKKYSEKVCLFLLPVFLNKEAAVQTKAAKIIVKSGDPDSENLKNEIRSYAGSFLSDTTSLLEKFLPRGKNNKDTQSAGVEESGAWHISQSVLPIETVSDFIFFAPQVFSKNEPNDFDLFLDALVRLNTEINEEHLIQLEPAFKAALKMKGNVGMHHLYATFFMAYGCMKSKKASPILNEAKKEFPDLENWGGKRTPLIFKAYQQFLLGIFQFLEQEKNLPLLSVPDRTPCWINIRVLTDKLKIYQNKKELPVPFDLQRALLRVRKEDLEESKKYAEKKLNKDYYELLTPVFDSGYFKNIYEKSYLDGNFSRKFGTRKIYKGYVSEEIPELTVSVENKEISADAPLLDHLFNSYHGVYNPDLIRIAYTAPYFSGSVFAKKYNETLSNAVYQYDSKLNTEFLDAWMKLDLPFQPMHYLFLSAGMFSKDKTFSGTAFEAIIHSIVSADFDIEALGIMIGEKISFGLVPVKRLTDGILGVINLSSSHNQAFEKLLIAILTVIDQPVLNLKKLLELYEELLNLNHSKTDDAVAVRLKGWKNENNLKKILLKLKTNERKTL